MRKRVNNENTHLVKGDCLECAFISTMSAIKDEDKNWESYWVVCDGLDKCGKGYEDISAQDDGVFKMIACHGFEEAVVIGVKLIFCTDCGDVVKLRQDEKRYCQCNGSWGECTDFLNAEIGGKAIPLGFDNNSFMKAILKQPESGNGKKFEAFVIPKDCDTIDYIHD